MVQVSTPDRVLAVAGALFYSQGIRNVGIDAICKEAGVTKPTLYHHFGNKDGLVTLGPNWTRCIAACWTRAASWAFCLAKELGDADLAMSLRRTLDGGVLAGFDLDPLLSGLVLLGESLKPGSFRRLVAGGPS